MEDTKNVPEQPRRGRPPKIKAEIPMDKETTEEIKTSENDAEGYSVIITRDYYGKVDPFYLSQKDPNYEYRFLRDEHKNLTIKTGNLLFQKGGWQLVGKTHLLKIGIKEREIYPDGFYRQGDTILAFMPKKLFAEKEKYKMEKAKEPMEMINRMLKKGDSSVGGKDIHDSMRGIETAKQLGMK